MKCSVSNVRSASLMSNRPRATGSAGLSAICSARLATGSGTTLSFGGAASEGALNSINAAVDVCNAVSLHSGLPISVVDLDRARPPFRIGVAPADASYVFNASGQEIDLGGLLCLYDADGPCGNAVRDAQRTKTRDDTRATLSVVWGCVGFEPRLREAERWYRSLLESTGATTHVVATTQGDSFP